MANRNTPVLERIVEALGISAPHEALARLEAHFHNELLIVAGNTSQLAEFAHHLRLQITPEEQPVVLDHIANERMASMTIDHVEEAINTLFPDRFIEP